jgi:transposase
VFLLVKYDDEFKLRVVQAYLKGEGGYQAIAKMFGVPRHCIIQRWVNSFKNFGDKGIRRKKKHDTYSLKFKLDVIQFYLNSGESELNVANRYRINNSTLIADWLIKFRKRGIEGLSQQKGRPSMSNNPKNQKKVKVLTREQQLEHENELLRAELAFIKKLRASGINIPDRLMKSKPESSMNSEKNSD